MQISVIYPAYNEAGNIRPTIARSLEALRSLFQDFEILIIDDCGSDGTGAIADELAREHPEIRVLHNQQNLGQGASLLRGFREARGDLVLHNALDYPFDLQDLPQMLALLERSDVVVAVRRRRSGYSFYRTVMSFTNRALLRLLFDLKLRDYNFVQLYRKGVLEAVPAAARSTGFLTPSLLIAAFDRGFRISEVTVEYHPRREGVATAGRPKVVLATLGEMFRFWWRRGRTRRQESAAETDHKEP